MPAADETAGFALRGGGAAAALMDLIRRIGVLRHPIGVTRILRRHRGTLPAAIELGALHGPARIALVRGEEVLSYGCLRATVRATASSLADRLAGGSRVGVRTDATAGSVVLLAACIAAGVDVIPCGSRVGERDLVAVMRREGVSDVLEPRRDVRWSSGTSNAPTRRPGRLLMLSSGSTASPRVTARRGLGVRALVPMADLDRRIAWPSGAILVLPPLDHGHGLSAVVAGLLRGETVLLGSELPFERLAAMVEAQRPSAVTGVPLQLIRAARDGVFTAAPPATIVSGSSRLDDAIAEELHRTTGGRVIDCLGTTETGTFAVRFPPALFQPVAGVRIGVDMAGRVSVGSPLAADAVATGDSGRISIVGLALDGRADELVDSAGELVSPARVGRAIRALPQVHSCSVEIVADELRGEVLVARVKVHDAGVPKIDATTADHLREALLPVLGQSAMPRRIDVEVLER